MFRRSVLLPQLPGSAVHLLKILDAGDASGSTIERIVTADPALSASMIRIASSALYGGAKITTIRGAILRIGERSMRSLALSLALQSVGRVVTNTSLFDPYRHSRHALFTGMLASTLHAEIATTMGNLEWESEEVLAVGILHDLHYGVLARIAPEVFGRTVVFAKQEKLEMDVAFETLYGHQAWRLSELMYETWGLPHIFTESLHMLHGVVRDEDNVRSFGAIRAAHDFCREVDCGLEDWDVVAKPIDLHVWPLPPNDDLQDLMLVVRNEAEAFLQTSLAMAG